MPPVYYMSPYTPRTWEAARTAYDNRQAAFGSIYLDRGTKVVSGDVFLCYLIGEKEIIGALRVVSGPFPAGPDGPLALTMYEARFATEVLARLPLGKGVPLAAIREHSHAPMKWRSLVQGALKRVPAEDAEWIMRELRRRMRADERAK